MIDDALREGIREGVKDEELQRIQKEIKELAKDMVEKWDEFGEKISKYIPATESERRMLVTSSAVMYLLHEFSDKYGPEAITMGMKLVFMLMTNSTLNHLFETDENP